MKKIIIIILMSYFSSLSQSSWKRGEVTEAPLQLFHSTYALNLPTAETIKEGDFIYTIAHRFNTPVSSGFDNMWGLDGSATIRMSLGYAISSDFLVNLGRSNRSSNWDLELKYKAIQIKDESFPILVSFLGGTAYNQKFNPIAENLDTLSEGRRMQFYGSMIVNCMLFDKKLGIGVVPTFLYNAHLPCPDVMNSFVLGTYLQYYINEMYSISLEATPTVTGWRNKYDSYAIGLEMETGGHFFKFIFGNNTAMNLSQFVAGASNPFGFNNLHFGFQISRDL